MKSGMAVAEDKETETGTKEASACQEMMTVWVNSGTTAAEGETGMKEASAGQETRAEMAEMK